MRILLAALAVTGVVTSVAMTVIGLPEATTTQTVLLELASLPLSVSVAAGIALLYRKHRALGQRSRAALLGGLGLALMGLALILLAYLLGPRAMVHTGQLLVWLGLFAALIVVVRHQPRRNLVRYEIRDDDAAGSDAAQTDASL